MILQFESKADLDYFLSPAADHFYMKAMYDAKRIDELTLECNESFRSVFNNPLNQPVWHLGLKGKIKVIQ